MLRPTGNFGKFLTILLSLSVTGNIAATFYSMSLNIQVFIPWLVIVPRYVFALLATAVYALYCTFLCCLQTSRRKDLQGGSFGNRWIPQILQYVDGLPWFDRLLGLGLWSDHPCRTLPVSTK